MLIYKALLLATVVNFSSEKSLNILGIFPHPGKSHVDVFQSLISGLVNKGHNVTVISYVKYKHSKHRHVDLTGTSGAMTDIVNLNELFQNSRFERYLGLLGGLNLLHQFEQVSCGEGLKSKELETFLQEGNRFDVAIVEFFNSDCFAGVVDKFEVPQVGISSSSIMHWTNDRFGNPTHPAYIPNIMMDYPRDMSFLERVENLLTGVLQDWFFRNVLRRDDGKFFEERFGGCSTRLEDVSKNVSVMLLNSHFSLTTPRPFVPGVVEVGGIHVGKPKKLPNDLEKWINESAHGVIYFSLGSMIKGHTFPEEQRQAFLRAFARLPQRVLWKWETDTMPGKPDNVMIQKWMPQLDILSHPNVKAFISHGGLLGMTEAVHCGVPAVVMPQYGDQFTNAKALEANGGGVILNLREATEEKVYNALKTILDPNFRKGAQELSARFRDRPLPPLETAIYWVEYVARHRGAHHMRTAAVDMPFYKYFLLDVIAFLLLVFGTIAACMFYITRLIVRKIFGGKSQAAKVKTN